MQLNETSVLVVMPSLETSLSVSSRRCSALPHWLVGPINPRGPAISQSFKCFLYFCFTDLNANFKNPYLVLGVPKWGDPNFVGFIMKCTI